MVPANLQGLEHILCGFGDNNPYRDLAVVGGIGGIKCFDLGIKAHFPFQGFF